jgi:hypothetical protein
VPVTFSAWLMAAVTSWPKLDRRRHGAGPGRVLGEGLRLAGGDRQDVGVTDVVEAVTGGVAHVVGDPRGGGAVTGGNGLQPGVHLGEVVGVDRRACPVRSFAVLAHSCSFRSCGRSR